MTPARRPPPWLAPALLAATLAGCAPGAAPPVTSPIATREIGYGTVADAHAALSARPDVIHSVRGTYEVFIDDQAHSVWLFTLPGTAAYPALVRRQLVGTKEGVVMRSVVFCEASRDVCSLLQENAQLMDAEIVERLTHGPSAPPPADASPPAPTPDMPGLRV